MRTTVSRSLEPKFNPMNNLLHLSIRGEHDEESTTKRARRGEHTTKSLPPLEEECCVLRRTSPPRSMRPSGSSARTGGSYLRV